MVMKYALNVAGVWLRAIHTVCISLRTLFIVIELIENNNNIQTVHMSAPKEAGVVPWLGGLLAGCFFGVLPKRVIPKPDQHRKDIIQWESLGTYML